MDWGLGNPNKTAVLIACLMMVSWAFAAARFRPWGFWVGLIFNAGLGVCLIHTYSRGGVVALIGGQVVWWALRGRAPIREWIGFGVVVLGLAIYANLGFVEAGSRFFQGSGDRSITNRLEVWKDAPKMMIDAPRGWGRGNSGDAWSQFYQDPETRYTYRTLVNSHLTRLVEFGWLGRFFYLAGWIAVLVFCWPSKRAPALAVPLACWVVFGIGGVFSTVDETWILWVIPILALIAVVIFRLRSGWPRWRRQLLAIAGAALLILAGFAIFGRFSSTEIPISGSPGSVELGGRLGPPVVLFDPDPTVLGTHFGVVARQHLLNDPEGSNLKIVREIDQIPEEIAVLVFSGSTPEFESETDWIALNPLTQDDLVRLKAMGDRKPGKICIGGFRNDPIARLLRQGTSPAWELEEVSGKQKFLSNWLEIVYFSPNPNQIRK